MFILGNFINALAQVVDKLLMAFSWLIVARAVISWVNPDPNNGVVQFLYKVTEPILCPIRKILPPDFRFGIDISPIIAFLLIMFLRSFLVPTLFDLSFRMGG